jgi:hypothetical protein
MNPQQTVGATASTEAPRKLLNTMSATAAPAQQLSEDTAALKQQCITNEISWWIQEFDVDQQLRIVDINAIIQSVSFKVGRGMDESGRDELNELDKEFIEKAVRRMIKPILEQILEQRTRSATERKLRFDKRERVVCNIGSEWMSGTVQSLNEPDAEDNLMPYVVKIDPPVNRLMSVPFDSNSVIRPEVCFRQSGDVSLFTLYCLPQIKSKAQRFGVGDRVTCVIEDSVQDPKGIIWSPGTISEVEVSLAEAAQEQLPENGPFPVVYLLHRAVCNLMLDALYLCTKMYTG